jgi:DNA processing protein
MTGAVDLPPEAFAAGLADLPGISPDRLVALLRGAGPAAVWRGVLDGDVRRPDPRPEAKAVGRRVPWAEVAAHRDIRRRWADIGQAGIQVAYLGGPRFPVALADDPEPPGVLFWRGDLGLLARPCVAIVGTRQCTGYGRSVAEDLGRDLAEAGVCVISGLALGIDGAAHVGALGAVAGVGPLGVAASGLDMPYPRRHADLWRRVADAGAVISEAAPRQPAQSWRFPARNRLIAALAAAVVVVESHAAGGSMLTVAAAAERGVEVLAVPGPVSSACSEGTNQLLHEGLAPVRHAGDVLAALGDLRPWPPKARPERAPNRASGGSRHLVTQPASGAAPARTLEGLEGRVLLSIGRTPTATSVVADRTGVPLGALSVVLLQLERRGLVRGEGTWWERCDQP